MSSRTAVKEALNRLASGENVEDVANTLLGSSQATERPSEPEAKTENNEIVVRCFECEDFSADNEADLLTHYAEAHDSKYESVEQVFESYGLDFNQELSSLEEGDDEEDDDSEEDDSEDSEDDDSEEDDDEQEESAPLA